jgi:hypothetical protein
MYLIREVVYCKPGKVRGLVEKFKALGAVMERMGYQPFRIYTDVSGERFWTVVLESEAESTDAFREMEATVMANEEAQQAMSGYHDLVVEGRREIYTVEA